MNIFLFSYEELDVLACVGISSINRSTERKHQELLSLTSFCPRNIGDSVGSFSRDRSTV